MPHISGKYNLIIQLENSIPSVLRTKTMQEPGKQAAFINIFKHFCSFAFIIASLSIQKPKERVIILLLDVK